MRGPKPPAIRLSEAQRHGLEALVRRHGAPQQVAKRAQVVLLAAAGDNNAQIGRPPRLGDGSVWMRTPYGPGADAGSPKRPSRWRNWDSSTASAMRRDRAAHPV